MGRITDETVRRTREANDIVQVAEQYRIELRRAGTNFVGLCPFHKEKSPSFNVNAANQFFKCFGCDAKGDVISLVRMLERVEFAEAVEMLAQRAGIPVEREGGAVPREEGEAESRKALLWAASRTLAYFEEMLADVAEGRRARDYLASRGFPPETISAWRLGWAPDRWDGLLERLIREAGEAKKEKLIEVCLAAGVLRRNDEGRIYDMFRGRVMFPILDMQHRPVGFGGRILEEKAEAGGKYVNSPEGRLFSKRKILFGLNFAAREIGLTKTVIVVEGYTDTIMCHQNGIRNVVATLGTSLTQEHLQKLRHFIQPGGKAIALFDSDAAGEKATERAVRLFLEEDLPLEVVRVAALKDACEYLPRFGAEAFRQELAKGEEGFRYMLRRVAPALAGHDINAKSGAVESIMGLANACPNRVRREIMRREVATAANLPESALPQPAAAPGGTAAQAPEKRGLGGEALPLLLKAREGGRQKIEQRLLRYALERAEWAAIALEALPPESFEDPACARLAAALAAEQAAGRAPTAAGLASACPDPACAEALAAAVVDGGLELSERELRDLTERARRLGLERRRKEVLRDMQDAQARGDATAAEALLQTRMDLDRQIGGP